MIRVTEGLRIDRALRLVWQAAPRWAVTSAILLVVQSVLPLAWLYMVKLVVDRLTGVGSEGLSPQDNFEGLVILLIVALAISIATALLAALSGYANAALANRVTDTVQQLVQQKSVTLDMEYYENPLAYDKLHRAQREAPRRPTQIVRESALFGQNVLTLFALLGLLVTFHWGVVLVVLLASLPLIIYRVKFSQSFYEWHRSMTLTERQAAYLNDIVTTPETAKELRLFGFEFTIRDRFTAIRVKLRAALLKLTAQRHRKEFLYSLIASVAGYGTLAFIAYDAVHGDVSVGELVMYFGAFQIALTSLRSALNGIGNLYEHNLFLSSLDEFLQVPKRVLEPLGPRAVPRPFTDQIRVEGLTFRYPGTQRIVLNELNLTIRQGQTVALVGPNGSGKSTLIKLLCRLYDPTAGRITIDGIDIREFATDTLRREISVVFQDYVHYHMSARENIWLGRTEQPPDEFKIIAAARQAGIDKSLQQLKDGYDTLLSRSLADGEELSIGQWQKLSLARSLYRDAQLIVLDEPTSSMDAGAEHEFFDTFRATAAGRTAIVVSHRFSTVRQADEIFVFDCGRIIERGTHESLMSQSGLYARLYRQQASHYQA